MVLVVYTSDDTTGYNVGVSQPNATAGGFVDAAPGAKTNFPRGWRMRHVQGARSDGGPGAHKLPIANPGNALWTGTSTTFTIPYAAGSANFDAGGRIGERRTQKI